MASTKDVLDHHLKCFGENDLDGMLTTYAPSAVLFMPDGPVSGADAIRLLYQPIFAEFAKPGAAFSLKQQSVVGDYAYILWTAETSDNVYEMGRTPTLCGKAISWPSHSPARLRPRGKNPPSLREAAQPQAAADASQKRRRG